MHLELTSERTIKDVQSDFTNAYPFLKLEFFNNNIQYNSHKAQQKIDHLLKLKNAWTGKKQQTGELEISDLMTVLELENLFMELFGLYVQVFRKSGNIWLETTLTDKWTLKQQNDHGRELSQERPKNGDLIDFDLSRDSDH